MNQIDTTGSMPKIADTLTNIEKLKILCDREGWTSTDDAGPNIGITPSTLRSYFNGNRNPGKFTALYIDNLVQSYEAEGRKGLRKFVKGAAKILTES
ncbi:helix-turn-helix domain-containing protein [Geminisphaera colitermitum]|uniref:helix-turn-helix domain-containing protein n=1 Tax=Geminisphaera colitermitum TaxID=1148786 RepID=UPI000196555D|nr:helix-turn-helix transcriptional regulator [Geminisphaera colitermitum]